MINSKVSHCTSLSELYSEFRKQQEEAHGEYYCAQHDAVTKLMEDCETYKELGTHQGASAAAACLTNPKKVEVVDITFEKLQVSEHLFNAYCEENDIEFIKHEMSSTDKRCAGPVDLLVIDSLHNVRHLTAELALHSPYVKKHIVCHDTSILHGRANDALYQALVNFTSGINPWYISERETRNVGYTVISNNINT